MAVNVLDKFIYKLIDLGGGQNDAVDPLKIKRNEFKRIRDYVYDIVANLILRKGCTPLNSDSGTDPIKSFGILTQKAGTKDLIVSTGEYLKRLVGHSLSTLKSGLSPNKYFDFEVFNDMLYCVNGVDNVQVVMGDYSVRNAGYPTPTLKPTRASIGEGGLTGNYIWSYTFVYPGGESSESPVSDVLLTDTDTVRVTLGDAYPSGATGAKIYRTIKEGTYRLLLMTIDKPATYYDDNLSDGALGIGAPESNPPLVSKLLRLYKNYMLYVPKDYPWRIDYSQLAGPDMVEEESNFDVLPDNGEAITGLDYTINPDILVVFKERSIAGYSGTSPYPYESDPLSLRRINENIGCLAPFSIDRAGGDLIFLASDKRIYLLSRVLLAATETLEPIPISDRIDETMQRGLNPDLLPYSFGIYHNRRYLLFVASSTSNELDTILIWENKLGTKPWTTAMPVKGASLGRWFDSSNQEITIIGGASSPRIYQFLEGTSDGGVPINPLIQSRRFDVGNPFNNKEWKLLRILAEGSEDFFFRVRIYVSKDGELSLIVNEPVSGIPKAPGAPILWGQGTWGVGNWGSNITYSNTIKNIQKNIYINTDGEFMEFLIENLSASSEFKFKGFEIEGTLLRSR